MDELRFLLEAKTDPNTLVDSVRKEQRPDKFNLLIEYKADVSGPSVLEGWNDVTPLMLCMFSSSTEPPNVDVFRRIVQALAPGRILECVNLCFRSEYQGRKLNQNDTQAAAVQCLAAVLDRVGYCPSNILKDAARFDAVLCIRYVLERFPGISDKKKSEALLEGVRHREMGAVKELLDNKADPNHNSRNFSPIYSPLYKAVSGSGDHIDIVRLLVQHKADVNERVFAGFRSVTEILMFNRPECRTMYTPLSLTAHSNVAKCLILNKADPDVPCIHHKTLILARNAVAASKEIREQARCCVRQYARAIAFSRCVHPLSEFFSCYIGLRKFMGGILLGYYRPTVSEDFETDMYSKMF